MNNLVNESGGFAPTRKYHLVPDLDVGPDHVYVRALCGAAPSAIHWNVTVGDREEFERLCPERICKSCLAKEEK
jgi:hypothetical protein